MYYLLRHKKKIIRLFFIIIILLFPLQLTCSNFLSLFKSKSLLQGEYKLPSAGNDIIGEPKVIITEPNDTFQKISKNFDVTVSELQIANPHINPTHIAPGTAILVPVARILPPEKYRNGIVINIPELRLFYFTNRGTVMSFPVALGRTGWHTPLGKTFVVRKAAHPDWYPPASIRAHHKKKTGRILPKVVPAGKNNPLGEYAIYLNIPKYLIHGTNDPNSIGRLVTSGCIRMFNQDIAKLYKEISPGIPVYLIYYPFKVGWKNQRLYLQAYSPVKHIKGLYQANSLKLNEIISEISKDKSVTLNKKVINKVLRQQNGYPEIISNMQQEIF